MALNVVLFDSATNNAIAVDPDGELRVVIEQYPRLSGGQEAYPFSQFFTADGTPTGSNDMRVDGSTTPQEFFIIAQPDIDIWVKSIRVRISDPGANLDEFGALTALTNGVSWTYHNQAVGTITIADEIKSNLDFIELGLATPSVGTGIDAFKADISGGGGADTFLPTIDLTQTFGLSTGVHLKKGTLDRISFFVNDNLSAGIDTFRIKAFGVQV